jgi:plastocyanin domain-containing protein
MKKNSAKKMKTMPAKMSQSDKNKRMAMGVAGAGALTAAALAGAAAYWFSGKHGKAHKAQAKAWAKKARVEVEKQMKNAKKLGAAEYARIVDEAVKRYGSLENVSAADLMAAAQDMKSDWDMIQMHAKKMAHTVKSVTKKPMKKMAAKKKAMPKKKK